MIGLAAVAAQDGDLERAAHLLGRADLTINKTGLTLETFERQLFDDVEVALAASDTSDWVTAARTLEGQIVVCANGRQLRVPGETVFAPPTHR